MNAFYSEQLDKIIPALIALQSEVVLVRADSINGGAGKSRYADLATIIQEIRPVLVKNNLANIFLVQSENGDNFLETMLIHSSGQWLRGRMKFDMDLMKDNQIRASIHKYGALLTYMQRYTLCMLLGLGVDKDVDGGAHESNSDHLKRERQERSYEDEKIDEQDYEDIMHEFGSDKELYVRFLSSIKLSNIRDLPRKHLRAALKKIREIKSEEASAKK